MDDKKKKEIKGMIIRFSISLLIIGIILLIVYLIFRHLGYTSMSKEILQEKIEKTGAWGPIVFIVVSFLQVTFIPIPGAVTILAGNLLFGPWLSLFYSFIGMFLGSMLAFKLGRVLGRPFVNWVVGDKETVDQYLNKARGKEFVVFFFMFLLPMFPDDALCSIAGITPLKWSEFIFMQSISKPIGILGTLFFMSGEIIPFKGWGLIVISVVAILSIIAFIICFKNAEKINEKLNAFFDKIAIKFKRNRKKI